MQVFWQAEFSQRRNTWLGLRGHPSQGGLELASKLPLYSAFWIDIMHVHQSSEIIERCGLGIRK